MREKRPRLIVAFHTTAEAMATERVCRAHGLAGRLIPVPRALTADCGIAWSADPALGPALEALLAGEGIETAGFCELEI